MPKLVIVVHYHEIWLKGGNRRFFLSKLHMALKRALEGLPVERILRQGDRMLIEVWFLAAAMTISRLLGARLGVKFAARSFRRSPCGPNAVISLFLTLPRKSMFPSDSTWSISCERRGAPRE